MTSVCNNTRQITRRALSLVALSLAALSPSLQAQDKPPLKIMVGFPPGGSADILARMVAEMVAKAKTDPGNASYGTPGPGTLPHFMGVLMEQSAGISLNHVPFQGGAPANNALLGGHIGYKFDEVSETAEMHRAGKVRIIAVTGRQRDSQVPEVPTLKESGINMEATAWFAMYGPAGLKGDALTRLEKAMMKIARDPAMKDKMLKLGLEPMGSNSADLANAQKVDLNRWEQPIKATGVQLD